MVSRRKAAAALTATGLVLLAAGLCWWWWLPAIIEERAEAAIERMGLRGDVGSVRLVLRGAVLSDVKLEGQHGGLEVRIGEIGARFGLIGAAIEGTGAVGEVQARDVEVRLDLSSPGARDSLAAVFDALSARAADVTDASADRAVSAVGVTVVLRDEWGELIRVADASLTRGPGTLASQAASVELGAQDADNASLSGIDLAVVRNDGRIALQRLAATGGTLLWARRDAEGEQDEEEASAPSTRHRLELVLETLRTLTPPDDGDGAGGDDTGSADGGSGLMALLAPRATIELAHVLVESRTAGGREPVLRDLGAIVERIEADRVRLTGSGSPSTGGSLRWDLSLWPRALRGEGSLSFEDLPLAIVLPALPDIPWYEPERARLDGDLTIRGESAERIAIRGRATLRDGALSSPRIAPQPVTGLGFTIEGQGAWLPLARRLEVESATLSMERAQARFEGSLEWSPSHYVLDATATLPRTECSMALSAIPRDLLDEVTGFSWSGQIGGRARVRVDSRDIDATRLDLDVADGCEFQTVPPLADLRRFQQPFLHRVHEPDGTWFEMTTGPGTGNWTSIYAMSPYFVHAVLAHEDASFFSHHGFAPWAIREALIKNLREGRYVLGASTITMQLAKNLFLHREKTLARKVQEVLLTWWLESAMEKRDILELYFNVIEFGPGIYGIRNGAWYYFRCQPADLTPAQSAFLASILPAPKLYHGQYERGSLSQSLTNRVSRLLTHMHARQRIDQAALDYGLAELRQFTFAPPGAGASPAPDIPGETAPLPFATGRATWADWDLWGFGGEEEQEGDPPEEAGTGSP